MFRKAWKGLAAASVASVVGLASALAWAAPPPGFAEQEIARPDGQATWSDVVGLEFLDNGRAFAWERGGRVWIIDPDQPVTTPFINISDEVNADRDHGLLGFALHPNFINNGFVYLLYVVDPHHLRHCDSTQPGAAICDTDYSVVINEYKQATIGRLTRYTAIKASPEAPDYSGATQIDYASRRVLVGNTPALSEASPLPTGESYRAGCPILYESHSVGSLVFGQDGTLLASCGDGASYSTVDPGSISHTYFQEGLDLGILQPKENVGAFRSQLVDSLSGKIWRLDPDTGAGVASNPFYDAAAPFAPRSRVWALGLRNPYRMTLRPDTGSHDPADANPGVLYIGDVGWNLWEDLHVAREFGGQNFGWPVFEGMNANAQYAGNSPLNLDAPNPLYDGVGCAEEFLRFEALIVQDNVGASSWPNPCDAGQELPSTLDLFVHTRPVIDWRHGQNVARWAAFNETVVPSLAENPLIGQFNTGGSYVVEGEPFPGNTSIGGSFYSSEQFPAEYKGTYFHGDYGARWIRNFVFDANDFPVAVRPFMEAVGGVVAITENPADGSLYYATWTTASPFVQYLRRVFYVGDGNRAPVAAGTTNTNSGPAPLAVIFDASDSSDPDGDSLTYQWDFGDGSAVGTGVSVSHSYAGNGLTPYTAVLTVSDPLGASDQATFIISPNNTPPQAMILNPVDGATYTLASNTTLALNAFLGDAETGAGSLTCRWQNILHHNEHTHEDPAINSCAATTVISPLGCGAENYWFSLQLTVTDPQGLTTERVSTVYPRCDGNPPPVATDDAIAVASGATVSIPVLSNDDDETALAPSTVNILVPPAHGAASVNTDGTISYTHDSTTLPDEFHYTVSDTQGSVSNAARVLISELQAADTTPPSVPTGLSATAISSAQIDLSWNASTDDTGVAGYRVFRNESELGTTTETTFTDLGLESGTEYSYTVSAFDIATPPNESAQSEAVSATTPNGNTLADPNQGPGGPILVLTSAEAVFGNYYAEILRTEGLNAFEVADISTATEQTLAAFDVVILAKMPLTTGQVTLLTDWVTAGGNLIAMDPDPQLGGLLGLGSAAGTLSNGYLLIDTASGPGQGIVDTTMQFHGTATQFNLADATSLAMLYSNSATATTYPAITVRSVGANGGQAAAFAFDLAESIVYTRQGNPAWVGQDRDGIAPLRSNDLFFGGTEPDWVDLSRVAIPQADEQQRFLANLITELNRDRMPLPRFWYLPHGYKAAVLLTGDNHFGAGWSTRFSNLQALSPPGCSVADWTCLRGTVYTYANTTVTDAAAAAYEAAGFEVAPHVDTGCRDYDAAALDGFMSVQLAEFAAKFPSLPAPRTHRTHCVAWSGWTTMAEGSFDYGIRLDTNYYYFPGTWVNNAPGHFTGSAMPMRFAALDGTMIDTFQVVTQMTDESGQSYPFTIDTLLDRALGTSEQYGIFTVNAHSDGTGTPPGIDIYPEIAASAISRGVPLITATQLLNWLDARNASSFGSLNWSANTLGFTVARDPAAAGLRAMVPYRAGGDVIATLTRNGVGVAFSFVKVKGVEYAAFDALSGSYEAVYAPDTTAPVVSATDPGDGATGVSTSASLSVTFSEPMDPATINSGTIELRDAGDALVAAAVTYDVATRTAQIVPGTSLALAGVYTARIRGGATDPRVKDLSGNPLAADFSWTFTTWETPPPPPVYSAWPDTTTPSVPSASDSAAIEVGVKFRTNIDGFITGVRFYKGPGNGGTHVGNLWTAAGDLLASAVFTSESATGWQTVTFDAPVPVTANTVYVASYYAPNGGYAVDLGFFATSGLTSGPLYLLRDGENGGNGVFTYGANSTFPISSSNSANYWVDVVFTTSVGPDTTPPVVTATSPVDAAIGVSTNSSLSASFNEPLDATTVNTSTFELRDASNALVDAAVSYDAATRTARLIPSASLLGESTYTATLKGGAVDPVIRDVAGNALAADVSWSFATGVPVNCAANPTVAENCLPGNPASEWDVVGVGDPSIQGFATDISVNRGQTVSFKVDTSATDYRFDIYRLGYYGGLGARKITTVSPSATLPQAQPACLNDATIGLIDCGNWAVSGSWPVPTDAASGIYIAKLIRTDTGGASHIVFVVRDDASPADVLFQTADTTWQAYNDYGGKSLYAPSQAERAYKVSYNRPFRTRAVDGGQDWLFNAEYPMVRWLEANGYHVSYTTGVDSDRNGALIQNHKVFMSNGHDEYWSAGQRANVEAARDAGVHLAFFSGNEVFWKTRWENSVAGPSTPYRTLVSYKETHDNAKIDPSAEWTGTWRDPRFSPPADGGRPENALTGTIFMVNDGADASIVVPEPEGKARFWRNTDIATLAPGTSATLPFGTLGYEWDSDLDNGFRPAGLVRLSSTTVTNAPVLQDFGSTFASGTANHALTLYRAPSGALVFGAGTVQWAWGLDAAHDRAGTPVDVRMQQATVNLLADMTVQPATLQPGLAAAFASSDSIAPASVIVSPAAGTAFEEGAEVTISGTATDAGGGIVGGVEVSVDGGVTWRRAEGRETWTYATTLSATGEITLKSRAVDDSGNLEVPGAGTTVTVSEITCPCSIWNDSATPVNVEDPDTRSVEVGVKFRSDVDGFITGIRFYKGPNNGGTHVGNLWASDGTPLGSATFTTESASGWQQVSFATPVAIQANVVYVASYFAPQGRFAGDSNYFAGSGVDRGVLHALQDGVSGGNGVFVYTASSAFPTQSSGAANYWVDIVFVPDAGPQPVTVPDVVNQPQATAEAAIVAATLTVGNVTSAYSDTVAAGNVISQNPIGGTSVLPGTNVDLVISLGVQPVLVPDVVNQPQATAEAAIVAATLTVGNVTSAYSDTVAAGNVISQNPIGGASVLPGTNVDLVISLGVEPVLVPDVVNQPQAAAEAAIVAATLTVGNVTSAYDATVPAGNVISQNPIGGASALPGTNVDLVISLGVQPVLVPDVVNQPQATAEAAIVAATLTVGNVTSAYSDTVAAGNVISQNPIGGASALPGTPVDLVISLGVQPVLVPDVTGQAQAAAEAAIVAATLAVGNVTSAYSDTVAAGNVISQNPIGGASVLPGTNVDLVISLGVEPVLVPDVVNQPQATAEAAIVAATLTVGNVTSAYDATVPAGNVISQNPIGGASALPGTNVDLVISLGVEPVLVPDVVNQPQAAAEAAIVAATLTVGNVTSAYDATVPAGNVISQNPIGGASALPGTNVDLVISLGVEPVLVPDVVNQPQAAAEAAIVAATLTVGNVTSAYDATVPAGNVISQNPIGGASALPGTNVDLVISLGVQPVTVPDVVNQPQATAEAAIVAATLTVGNVTSAYSDTVAAGNVISQDPIGGASALPGTPVDLVVSLGVEPVLVPDVVNQTQAAAEAAIVAATLTVGNVTSAYSDTVAAGNVISQNPIGGTSVLPGTNVDLVISLGVEPVLVPDVVNQPQAAAEAAIVAATLTVGNVTSAYSDTVAAGNVISQNPIGGTSVLPGTPVDLVVSLGVEPVLVPHVVNQTQAAAEAAIVAATLSVGNITTAYSPTVTAGNVISQNPIGGTSVLPGTNVDLVISLGPPSDDTKPPSRPQNHSVTLVGGLPQLTWDASMDNVGVTGYAIHRSTDGSLGPVITTVGPVTTYIDNTVVSGERYTYAVSAFDAAGNVSPNSRLRSITVPDAPPVTVPNVVGLAQAAATTAITAVGLKVGTVTQAASETVPVGNVISQNPAGGASAALGSAVNLVISAGAVSVTVPNVVGLAQAAAESAISNAGLVPVVSTAYSATVPAGNVISQNPIGGTSVGLGSTVSLVVSLGAAPDDSQAPSRPQNHSVTLVGGLPQLTWDASTDNVGVTGYAIHRSTDGSLGPVITTVGPGTIYIDNTVVSGERYTYAVSAFDAAGNVSPNSRLRSITVPDAPPVTVPNVVGLAQAAATTAITAVGLKVGTVTQAASETVPVGNVISQNPAGGASAALGSAVNLVISAGAVSVTVPNVVGLAQAAAESAISNAGLVPAVSTAYSATVPAGNVISQNPSAGASVGLGSSVSLVVSLGAAPDDSQAPSRPQNHSVTLVGGLPQLTWDASTDNVGVTGYAIHRSTDGSLGPVITTLGAVTTYIDNSVVSGERYTYAVSAFDAAGNVSPNSRLRSITVPDAPPVTVPNVVGLTQAAATTAITAVGLKVGTVTQAASATVPVGNVISQNPAGGASAALGSAVNLVISAGAVSVTVPNVVGLAQAAAESAINNAGLVPVVSTAYSGAVPAGNVISQDPSGGASVGLGSSVSLVVSLGEAPTDTQAPSRPQNHSVTLVGGLPQLTWDASTDNVGVTGYSIHRSTDRVFGPAIATVETGTTFTDTTVQSGVYYTYAVVAFDAAGNVSPNSRLRSVLVP